jgi:hypothetical protein
MLAVACVGMLVYAVAGASPDGRQLAPAACSSDQAGPPAPGCFETAADKGSTPTTDKGSTPTTTKCETTTTTGKGGDKGSTTTTTEKSGDKGSTTTTTEKSGDKGSTTTTTEKSGDKGSTTTTTAKDDASQGDSGDPTAAKAAAPSTALDVKGDAATTAAKDSGGDSASKAANDTSGKGDNDCGGSTTTTTEKDGKGDGGGKGSTTTTTRKGGGKGSTTTTTEKDGKGTDKGSTTSTTTQGGTVDPQTPGDSGSDGSTDPGSSDPGDTPISPQEAPPYDAPDSDPGPAADPEEAADPGPADSFDMWDDEEEVAISPMEAPGSGSMLPVFSDFIPSTSENASGRRERSRPTGSSGRVQELAAPPVVTLRGATPSPAQTESAAVSRRLGGLQTSVTESAFPANIISTPGEFPVNHRDPLAAAALVVLIGVSRELFKVWRRRATDFWPA